LVADLVRILILVFFTDSNRETWGTRQDGRNQPPGPPLTNLSKTAPGIDERWVPRVSLVETWGFLHSR